MTTSLFLRTLKSALNRHYSPLAIQHSSNGVNRLQFCRYGAIRTFLEGRGAVELKTKTLSQGSRTGIRRSVLLFEGALATVQLSRKFHSSGWKDDDHSRGTRKSSLGQPKEKGSNDHTKPDKNTGKKSEQPLHTTDKPSNQNPRQTTPDVETPKTSETTTPDKFPSVDGPSQPPLPLPNYENYPEYLKRLAMSLPHLHRPTRDDFLNVASGFWQRARIRFKWFTIKSFRKFNADDISAFVTWFLTAQFLWILVGTTTFFSVVFATANSLRLQEYVARAISDYLTSETGVTIIFESAIVPKWKDSRISFKNIYISRRPPSDSSRPGIPGGGNRNSIGHKAAVGYDVSSHPAYNDTGEEEEEFFANHDETDINYSMFDLNVDSIDVTLSLWRWFDGKGLVEDAVVKGVRGVLDRRSIQWDPDHPLDPATFRHAARSGDFELNSLQLEDVLITVYQPDSFRPYTASIFRAELRCLRKQWLFYDFLSAENIVGQFDNCLFSLHKPQSIGRTTEKDLQDGQWARMSRIRIDGVNIDHLQGVTTLEGPISWITSGKLDAVLDIKFPQDPHGDVDLNVILGEIADAITAAASSSADRIPGQRELAKPPLIAPPSDDMNEIKGDDDLLKVIIDIDLRFRDLKAAVPIFTKDLSYVNMALIRPIVYFMNANRTLVPIRCRVVKDLSDFDGAWTMWETGLMDEIALKTYDALAYHVTQANMNRRVKAVGVWSLQMTASAVLSAMRSMIDPMRAVYTNGLPYYDAVLAV